MQSLLVNSKQAKQRKVCFTNHIRSCADLVKTSPKYARFVTKFFALPHLHLKKAQTNFETINFVRYVACFKNSNKLSRDLSRGLSLLSHNFILVVFSNFEKSSVMEIENNQNFNLHHTTKLEKC